MTTLQTVAVYSTDYGLESLTRSMEIKKQRTEIFLLKVIEIRSY